MYESALEGKNYEGPHLSGVLSAGADFVFAPPRNSNRAKGKRFHFRSRFFTQINGIQNKCIPAVYSSRALLARVVSPARLEINCCIKHQRALGGRGSGGNKR
jgi:hypothetical protein